MTCWPKAHDKQMSSLGNVVENGSGGDGIVVNIPNPFHLVSPISMISLPYPTLAVVSRFDQRTDRFAMCCIQFWDK